MAQLSLYLDKHTLAKLEKAARREKLSLSKWVRRLITGRVSDEWPEGYSRLFGSVRDRTFVRHAQPSLENDAKRAAF
jgi:hypothetical protein